MGGSGIIIITYGDCSFRNLPVFEGILGACLHLQTEDVIIISLFLIAVGQMMMGRLL